MNASAEQSSGRLEFDTVFCKLLPRLHRRALAVMGNPDMAEDALQDAYIRLAARPERMLGHPEPYAYALATVINGIRDRWRKRRREECLIERVGYSLRGWDGGIGAREDELRVRGLLTQLTPRQASVVRLVDLDGHTLDQAALILGLHRGTIARTRTRALDKLRDQIEQERKNAASAGDDTALLIRGKF
ncbi:MAG TPA: RNA polymerase sigma factor [Streptosporangiaceae bacterium]|nr:RNA polymerase sigma factor [Streptosporangiaceae bacterium]